jgi:hypothetical protein
MTHLIMNAFLHPKELEFKFYNIRDSLNRCEEPPPVASKQVRICSSFLKPCASNNYHVVHVSSLRCVGSEHATAAAFRPAAPLALFFQLQHGTQFYHSNSYTRKFNSCRDSVPRNSVRSMEWFLVCLKTK